MSRGGGGPAFGARCTFCGTDILSVRRDGVGDDPCVPRLFLCPECGAYRLCEEFDDFLQERPVRRIGAQRFVTESALEGFLPRLCIDHQDFEEIANPFVRAWQKCRQCRIGPPLKMADGRLVHRASADVSCQAHEEWRELETMKAGRKS